MMLGLWKDLVFPQNKGICRAGRGFSPYHLPLTSIESRKIIFPDGLSDTMLNAAARIQPAILRGITFFITVAKREVVDRKIRCGTVVHVEFQCGISGIISPNAALSCFVIYSKERTFHFFDHLLGRAELNEQTRR